jgi:hypothetical protein
MLPAHLIENRNTVARFQTQNSAQMIQLGSIQDAATVVNLIFGQKETRHYPPTLDSSGLYC